MHAPVPPFRDSLTFVREAVEEDMPAGSQRELVLRMLKDWEDAPAEDIWKTITDASVANGKPPPEAVEFIEWLIDTRLVCEKASHVVEQWPAEKAKLLAQADRDWKGPVSAWPNAAVKRAAVEDYEARMDAVLGRKKFGAPRKRFMKLLRQFFVTNCGRRRPLNKVVAALTEIAFGPATSEGAVRGTERATKQRDR
jgi:hypothetical protein